MACKHEQTEVRFRIDKCRRPLLRAQCLACGHGVGPRLSVKHHDVATVPHWDDALERAGNERETRDYAEQFTNKMIEAQTEHDEWLQRYTEYLKTDEWRDKRARVFRRDRSLCQACLKRAATQVHHLSYRHAFDEPLFELVAVCGVCHEALTKASRRE